MRLSVMLDAPQDPIATITNANVVDGEFKRSSVKRSERNTMPLLCHGLIE